MEVLKNRALDFQDNLFFYSSISIAEEHRDDDELEVLLPHHH